jgi:hypothetical protein
MNSGAGGPDDQALAQLRQLPAWQPPSDFAVRLAAAAAHQASNSPAACESTFAWLRWRLLYRLPLALGAGALALVLLAMPWATVAESTALPWLVAACGALVGLVMAVRVLRAP